MEVETPGGTWTLELGYYEKKPDAPTHYYSGPAWIWWEYAEWHARGPKGQRVTVLWQDSWWRVGSMRNRVLWRLMENF
jgi:hypothetical protein